MSLIYIISGEASGDALGAGLMRELKTLQPDITFAGVGGAAMQQEGLKSLFPYQELAVMGFWEVLPHILKFLKLIDQTLEDIAEKQPTAIVTIDSPGFNFRLARILKSDPRTKRIKRIHYVAPSVWAYKPQRARKTAKLFDLLLAILPFEPPYFEKEGLKTIFVGHPVLWQKNSGSGDMFRKRHNLKDRENLLLVLPGSRNGEVKQHLPVFLAAAKQMEGYKVAVLAGPQVKEAIQKMVPADVMVCDFSEKYDAFAATTFALSKSGTVTLELAAAGVPMVVAHKVTPISAWLIRKMLLIKYASLVNIAAGKEIVPELMQERCTVSEITKTLQRLMRPEEVEKQKKEVAAALTTLRGKADNPSLAAAHAVMTLKTS